MTYREFYEAIKAACIEVENAEQYSFVGVRYENHTYQVGDTMMPSKHNPDRDDERDFPEYGSMEYDDLPDLPGTSAWHVYTSDFDYAKDIDPSKIYALQKPSHKDINDTMSGEALHAYVIAGNHEDTHSDADHGEIVIIDPVVIKVLY